MAKRSPLDIFYRTRSSYRRFMRLLYPSPAELQLIRILGGRFITIKRLRHYRTGFGLSIIYKQPRLFKNELVRREVRIGRYYADFGVRTPYYKKAIEVDGDPYHMDVVKEFERESYMYQRGWRLLRIRAPRVWNDTKKVQNEVIKFLIN